MDFLPRTAVAAALAFAVVCGAAMAKEKGFSGNWPLVVSQSQHSNGSYCLTLVDGGSYGWPHSGFASMTGPGGKLPYGTFQVINGLIIVTMQQSGYGQNAGLVFVGVTHNNKIESGTYDQVYGGEEFDSGALAFGVKGGC